MIFGGCVNLDTSDRPSGSKNQLSVEFKTTLKECHSKGIFYGVLNKKTYENKVFLDREIDDLLVSHQTNVPENIMSFRAEILGYKNVLITGKYAGSTAYLFNVKASNNLKKIMFKIDFIDSKDVGFSLMNHPFWAGKVPEHCEIFLIN